MYTAVIPKYYLQLEFHHTGEANKQVTEPTHQGSRERFFEYTAVHTVQLYTNISSISQHPKRVLVGGDG